MTDVTPDLSGVTLAICFASECWLGKETEGVSVRKSWIQLYAPFLVLMMVQALFVAVSPSRGPQQQELAALNGSATGSGAALDSGTGAATDANRRDR